MLHFIWSFARNWFVTGENLKPVAYFCSASRSLIPSGISELRYALSRVDEICINASSPAAEKDYGHPQTHVLSISLVIDLSRNTSINKTTIFIFLSPTRSPPPLSPWSFIPSSSTSFFFFFFFFFFFSSQPQIHITSPGLMGERGGGGKGRGGEGK